MVTIVAPACRPWFMITVIPYMWKNEAADQDVVLLDLEAPELDQVRDQIQVGEHDALRQPGRAVE